MHVCICATISGWTARIEFDVFQVDMQLRPFVNFGGILIIRILFSEYVAKFRPVYNCGSGFGPLFAARWPARCFRVVFRVVVAPFLRRFSRR